MAEKSKSESNELGLGTIFILLILGVFVIWVLTGGPANNKNSQKVENKTTFFPTAKIPSYGEVKNSNDNINSSKKTKGFGNVASYGGQETKK